MEKINKLLAYELGHELAKRNCIIVSGGYGSTAAAVNAGASQILNSEIEGHLCTNHFTTFNEVGHITKRINHDSNFKRIEALIDTTDIFIFLPGELETATQLMITWNAIIEKIVHTKVLLFH